MSLVRTVFLRRISATVFLLASLMAQIQVVYACTHVDIFAQGNGCCDRSDQHPCQMDADMHSGCCGLDVDTDTNHFVSRDNKSVTGHACSDNKAHWLGDAYVIPGEYTERPDIYHSHVLPYLVQRPSPDIYRFTLRIRE